MKDQLEHQDAPGESSPGAQSLSPAEAAIIRRDLQHFANSGEMTREQANADLQRLGMDPLPPVAEQPTNDDPLPPATSPGAYRLPRLGESIENHAATRALAFAMHDAQLPASVGSSISAQIEATARTFAKLSEVDRVIYTNKSRDALARTWGDAAPAKIAAAQKLVREMDAKRPGIVELLERTGAGSNPLVVSMLADAAARLSARRASS